LFILSPTKLEIRTEQFLPGSEGVRDEKEGVVERGGEEMAQTLYAHMNKQQQKKVFFCRVVLM
jgi:hypothetical protein